MGPVPAGWSAGGLLERWRAVVDGVRASSPRFAVTLSNAQVKSLSPGEVVLGFGPEQGFHKAQLCSASGKASVEKLLSAHLGRPTRLVIDDAVAKGPTLAEQERQGRAARERSVEDKVRTHAAVLTALRVLGGELEHITVLEPEPAAAPPERTDEDAS